MCQFSANSNRAGVFDKRSKIFGRFRDRHLKWALRFFHKYQTGQENKISQKSYENLSI